MADALAVRAHAKLNLELRVTGARPDGFHELETVFQSVALHDTLTFECRPGPLELVCDVPDVPSGPENLVWRALHAIWGHLGRGGGPEGLEVRLTKRIPMQAGLGGGSADAAAALVGAARILAAPIGRADLGHLAAELGSDVAFFLTGGTAVGRGRGERLVPLPDLAPRTVVVVCPRPGVSTADAYRWYDSDGVVGRSASSIDATWALCRGTIRNDLQAPVVHRRPDIGRAQAALLRQGASTVGMSGSGSAVFGLYEDRPTAVAAAGALAGSGWPVTLTRTVTRDDYGLRWFEGGTEPPP